MSNSQRPHGLQPTRLFRPWDFPGKSTGVIYQTQKYRMSLGYIPLAKNQLHCSNKIIRSLWKELYLCTKKEEGKMNIYELQQSLTSINSSFYHQVIDFFNPNSDTAIKHLFFVFFSDISITLPDLFWLVSLCNPFHSIIITSLFSVC